MIEEIIKELEELDENVVDRYNELIDNDYDLRCVYDKSDLIDTKHETIKEIIEMIKSKISKND